MTPAAPYRYVLAEVGTGDLITELPFNDVTWGAKVSAAGEFTGSVPATGRTADLDLFLGTLPARTCLYALRRDSRGLDKAVFGGIIASRAYDAASRSLRVSATSFEGWLFRRHIRRTLALPGGMDQYEVARRLLRAALEDMAGVPAGTDDAASAIGAATPAIGADPRMSGKTQDAQTWDGTELKTYGDALKDYADNINGFEWNIEVTWDGERFRQTLVFRDTPPGQTPVGEAYAGQRPGVDSNIFEYPGNVMTLTVEDSEASSATRQFVVGGSDGTETGKARGSWTNVAALEAGWPLLEAVESSKHSSATSPATLRRYAEVYGRRSAPPVTFSSVTVNGNQDPEIGTYALGDWCSLVASGDPYLERVPGLASGLPQRIAGFSVSVPTSSQLPETVSLELEDEWGAG